MNANGKLSLTKAQLDSILGKDGYDIRTHIDERIKVNNVVKFKDGSGLSIDGHDTIPHYIICSYESIFKTDEKIEEMAFEVVETNIKDRFCYTRQMTDINGKHIVYLQDVAVISANGVILRTSSKFVYRII